MEIAYVDPRTLKANPWNSNYCTPKQEAQLEESLKRLGNIGPTKVRTLPNGDLEVLGGQHRTEASIRLGQETIPIINLGSIPDKKAREISLVDNGRYGSDDPLKLIDVIEFINEGEEVDLDSFLPYDSLAVDAALASKKIDLGHLGDREDPEPPDDDYLPGDELTEPLKKNRSQIMRFSVSPDDADQITSLINEAIERHKLVEGGALANAGAALSILLLGV